MYEFLNNRRLLFKKKISAWHMFHATFYVYHFNRWYDCISEVFPEFRSRTAPRSVNMNGYTYERLTVSSDSAVMFQFEAL